LQAGGGKYRAVSAESESSDGVRVPFEQTGLAAAVLSDPPQANGSVEASRRRAQGLPVPDPAGFRLAERNPTIRASGRAARAGLSLR
jgi:hypothetical protein